MKKWPWKKRWVTVLATLVIVPLLWYGGMFAIGYFNLFGAHQHCSKGLSLSLRQYASENGGKFHFHTNGFGDALLLLLKEDLVTDARTLTAPGDDGRMFNGCLTNGANVDESKCSRIYIQGLSETDTGRYAVALAFDAYPTPGGDHGRRPWGEPIRDVAMADGSVEFVHEKSWPKFATNQIHHLVESGMNRSEMEKLFGIDSNGNRLK